MERRHDSITKSSPLPVDYLKMVCEVFSGHFDAGLAEYKKTHPLSHFSATGEVFTDEIVMAVSLVSKEHLAATTVHASTDFDPKASSPTAQDLLDACVDAIGSAFGSLLDPSKPDMISKLGEESLAALEGVPYDWVPMEFNHAKIFIKVDKANPIIDRMADDWLKKHDPNYEAHLEDEQKETEKLFFTGPKNLDSKKGGSDGTHE